LEVSDLKTASGLAPRVCTNPEAAKAIKIIAKPAKTLSKQPT
jgi:hypothetical protein